MEERPRKLTEDEIQDILKIVPNIRSAAHNVSDFNTKSMKDLLREQLKDIEITPLGVSDLKAEITRQFNETVARPGTMVGITSSEAMGKNITQAALNSFHTSGSAKNVSTGVDRITELINATKEPKNPSCSIFFKDTNLSFDDIISKKRPEITEITVKDLVIGTPDIENSSDIIEPYWYSFYRVLFKDNFHSKDVLRLKIDPNLMYAYKLTMEEICSKIETGQPVVCVYSPLSEGRIDIYPIEKLIISKLKEMKIDFVSTENAGLIFLSMIVVPALDKLRISGISGIKQIFPVDAGVWQIVKEEQPVPDVQDGWFLILNSIRMKITGISIEKLVKFCETLNMKVIKIRENYISVISTISPTQKVGEALEQDRNDEREYEKKRREEGARVTRRPPSDISIASKMIYADSTGANLKELLAHPDIDSSRTYCNNVHEIVDALGIEAGRTFLIKELIDVVSGESYINPRHIVLLSDFMCSLGKVYGVTSTGISRQPIGALEKASFEKAMKHFKEAAVFGEEKEVSGTSASIYIGKKALVGTGYSETYIRPENLIRYNETRELLNKDPNLTLDIGAFNDVIDKINSTSGTDVAFVSGAMEEEMFGEVEKEPEIAKPVPPSKISETVKTSSPSILVKGATVRSMELEEAAELLSTAPCLRPPKLPEATITTLETPQVQLNLAEEMERIAETGKPVMPSLVSFPPLKPLKPLERPKIERKPQPAKIFDLEEYLK